MNNINSNNDNSNNDNSNNIITSNNDNIINLSDLKEIHLLTNYNTYSKNKKNDEYKIFCSDLLNLLLPLSCIILIFISILYVVLKFSK